MSETVRIPLERIKPNPFQTRLEEDKEHVASLAADILQHDLLQAPAGRFVDPGAEVELAFGMSRLAAFRLLDAESSEPGTGPWSAMPVEIRKLTDREMFEAGLAENLKRKDLSPIEKASAMRRYMKEFDATSDDTAILFGYKDGGSVRNALSLLGLPAGVQEKLQDGTLPERAGRSMVSLAKLNPAKATDIAQKAAKGEITPVELEEEIGFAMSRNAELLSSSYQRGRVGGEWWALDEGAPAGDGHITDAMLAEGTADVVKRLKLGPGAIKRGGRTRAGMVGARERRSGALFQIADSLRQGLTTRELVELHTQPAELVDRVAHLLRPPACSACPFHSLHSGDHYCGLAPCFRAKRKGWIAAELRKVQAKRNMAGIAVHNAGADGRALGYPDHVYYDDGKSLAAAFKRWLLEKNPDLRLQEHATPDRGGHTGSAFVRLAVVGATRDRVLKAREGAKTREATRRTDWDAVRRKEQQNHRQAEALMARLAPEFAKPFESIALLSTLQLILRMVDDNGPGRGGSWRKGTRKLFEEDDPALPAKQRAQRTRVELGHYLIGWGVHWSAQGQGLAATRKAIEGLAKRVGLKLKASVLEEAVKAVAGDKSEAGGGETAEEQE